jgi:hypothetical protein
VSVIDLDQTWSRGDRQLTGAAYHEGVPAHGGAQALEGVGGAELGDDPVVAVPIDDGPVEVEHHHHIGGGRGHRRLATVSRFLLGGEVGCRPRPVSSPAFICGFADL